MVLKEIVNESLRCRQSGAYHVAFLLALCAADATAKKCFPTEQSVGRRFKKFLSEQMQQLVGRKTYWVAVEMPDDGSQVPLDSNGMPALPEVGDDFNKERGNPRMVLMEGVLYHAFRCALAHEANLPDVELLPPTPSGAVSVKVDTKVRISADIIGRLLCAIVQHPANSDVFSNQLQLTDESRG